MSVLNNKYQIINNKSRLRRGSALILAMVLTSLLAIVAVMFLISSRVDNISTSAIADNENLNHAVDTVIAQISENLSIDVFRGTIDPNQYADYPDPCNYWLASLEPYQSGLYYRWRQVSDIYGNLFPVSQNMIAEALPDYNNSIYFRTAADADGDGVGDSMWVQVQVRGQGITSSKGKPVFAAIRIIDNSAMLNVNTGYKFSSSGTTGSSQLDVNLMSLSWRPNDLTSPYAPLEETALRVARSPVYPSEPALPLYEQAVIWNYVTPDGNFTPFDISDELEMRYRFLLNHEDIDTRLDEWGGEFRDTRVNSTPYDSGGINEWFKTSCIDANLTAPPDREYAYRHIATAYNFDRIIDPIGDKMLNVNLAPNIDPNFIRKKIADALVAGGALPADANVLGAQITANLIDYVDADSNVTVVGVDILGVPTYRFGFETPCIYISELVQSFIRVDANSVAKSYAIELFKPYITDPIPEADKWWLQIDPPGQRIPVTWPGNSSFHVIWKVDVNETVPPFDVNVVDTNIVDDLNVIFTGGQTISLWRKAGSFDLAVDSAFIPIMDPCSGWLREPGPNDFARSTHSVQRDITLHKCIRKLWEEPIMGLSLPSTLGAFNAYIDSDGYLIQAHPQNGPLTNIGEIGAVFRSDAYITDRFKREYDYFDANLAQPAQVGVRIDLTMPVYQRLFNYLTLIDPYDHGYTDPNYPQTRIKGRININTAPWFVLAQLPWVSQRISQPLPDYRLARAITAYRDTVKIPRGFQGIGELMQVGAFDPNLFYYTLDSIDLNSLPDLTPSDGAPFDFEERDAIFARMSNLVTVRSDVFTAYILVRIDKDGPQKRVIAILDRSGVTPIAGGYTGKVKIIAIQSVPDPR